MIISICAEYCRTKRQCTPTRAPFRTVKRRRGSIISSAATVKKASGYTQSSSKTAADVLVSMALIASICIGEIFAAGETAFIMQLGALLEELTVARAQPRSRQRRLTSIAGKPQDKNKNTHEICECRDKFNFVGLPISIKLQKPTAMGNRSGRFLYSLESENLFCLFALKGFCNLPEQLAYGQVLRARVLALSAADAVRCFAVILGVDLIVAVRVPVAAELLCVHA